MFQQVPLVEMDGLKLVQTKAILNYISAKYNLYGKDLKERVKYRFYMFCTLIILLTRQIKMSEYFWHMKFTRKMCPI